MKDLIETANLLHTRRHYARFVNGRGEGTSLCTEGLPSVVKVCHQTAVDRMSRATGKQFPAVADLPLCRRCAAKARRSA